MKVNTPSIPLTNEVEIQSAQPIIQHALPFLENNDGLYSPHVH